jgi:hypothetical protein
MTPRSDAPGDTEPATPTWQDLPAQPDEDGPHDVPDDTVIEATLPTVPITDQR